MPRPAQLSARSRRLCLASLAALLLAAPATASAANGAGTVTSDFGGIDSARDVAIQSDGKYVVAGTDGRRFVTARYRDDGSLDPSFGDAGVVKSRFGGAKDTATSVAIQPDGKIVVAGTEKPVYDDYAAIRGVVVRYRPDGSLDRSFGERGFVRLMTVSPADVLVQPDGKIVLGSADGGELVIARLLSSGERDFDFGTWGLARAALGSRTATFGGLAFEPDGKLVADGTRRGSAGGGSSFAVTRFTQGGTLDTGFAGDGIVTGPAGARAKDVGVQAGGRLVAVGRTTGGQIELARYDADGTPDGGFGTGGIATSAFPGVVGANALATRPDGELVVAGYAAPRAGAREPSDIALARFTAAGVPDPAFGAGGEVRTDLSGFRDVANALALAPDGGLVAVGASTTKSGGSSDFAVARYRANGTSDSSFGSEAFRLTP